MEENTIQKNPNENSTAIVGYLMGLGALGLFFEKPESQFIRFHAIQSVFYSLIYSTVLLLLYFGIQAEGMFIITASIATFMWMLGIIYAVLTLRKSNDFRFPLIGDWAEKMTVSKR